MAVESNQPYQRVSKSDSIWNGVGWGALAGGVTGASASMIHMGMRNRKANVTNINAKSRFKNYGMRGLIGAGIGLGVGAGIGAGVDYFNR